MTAEMREGLGIDPEYYESPRAHTRQWADEWLCELHDDGHPEHRYRPRRQFVAALAVSLRQPTPPESSSDALSVFPALKERVAWVILVAMGLASGALAGLSVAAKDFPIKAPVAAFIVIGVLVLMATLAVWSRDNRNY